MLGGLSYKIHTCVTNKEQSCLFLLTVDLNGCVNFRQFTESIAIITNNLILYKWRNIFLVSINCWHVISYRIPGGGGGGGVCFLKPLAKNWISFSKKFWPNWKDFTICCKFLRRVHLQRATIQKSRPTLFLQLVKTFWAVFSNLMTV
jgi:hypothetical protein